MHGLGCLFNTSVPYCHAMLNNGILRHCLLSTLLHGWSQDGITMFPGKLADFRFRMQHFPLSYADRECISNSSWCSCSPHNIKKCSCLTSHAYPTSTPVSFETAGVYWPLSIPILTQLSPTTFPVPLGPRTHFIMHASRRNMLH